MARIRVLVVEDSITVRKRIVELIANDPELEVVGEAADGRQGVERCQALRPDVVTMDMMLPVMSGLAATEYIMAYCPTPILIVSASTNRGELFRTYEALAAGALDVLEKPLGTEVAEVWERTLLARIKLLSRIKVITHPRGRLGALGRNAGAPELARGRAEGAPRLIAVGVSTGGPAALVELLRALPEGFPIPILLVIHLAKLFAASFAEWLDAQAAHAVRFAEDGTPLPSGGGVWIAPPDVHLAIRDGHLRLGEDAERHSCRPSVDVLFESVARELGARGAGCLLTGMGRDGAAGLLAIRLAGGRTIAQDEASSVVFGMPREAILLGAAQQVLALDKIGPTLAAWARGAEEDQTP